MRMINGIACLCLLAPVLLLAGCDKKVKLVFTNTTQQERSLMLVTPEMSEDLGVLPPGARRAHNVKFPQDELPAECFWKAGDKGGSFTIDKKTKNELFIYVGDPSVGPLKKGDEVEIKRIKNEAEKPVHQEEVVE